MRKFPRHELCHIDIVTREGLRALSRGSRQCDRHCIARRPPRRPRRRAGRCTWDPVKHRSTQPAEEKAMLYTIAVMLLILWLRGFVSGRRVV
jgi:hypothetical protein